MYFLNRLEGASTWRIRKSIEVLVGNSDFGFYRPSDEISLWVWDDIYVPASEVFCFFTAVLFRFLPLL